MTIQEGTFDFCERCPAHSHCCQRIKSGQIESPYLSNREANIIASVTAKKIDTFAEPITTKDDVGFSLRVKDGKCIFYEGGACSIYKSRPLDCRLFPFDIMKENDALYWIVYLHLCPRGFDYRRYFESAKNALNQSDYGLADIQRFAMHGAQIMQKHQFEIIEPVVLSRHS